MATQYSVSLGKLVKDNGYTVKYMPEGGEKRPVISKDVNRPGLILAGYEEFFDPNRIQIMGLSETSYLGSLSDGERRASIERLMRQDPPAVIITRKLEPVSDFLELAEKYGIPVLGAVESTSSNTSSLISYLSVELAERITRHGVLVDVSGEGILLIGDSGIGKSETAIELVKRGHRLIADDAVEIRRVSEKTLVGMSPGNIRHFVELRGVGIINAANIFGMGAVKQTEKIDMVIVLEQWDPNRVYDRMGLEDEYSDIMGVKVPAMVVPVKPGRNLAIIIEVAAINNRQKRTGYNAAAELMKNLGMDQMEPEPHKVRLWNED